MDQQQLKCYMARITQANRSELVVIVYDLILYDIKESKQQLHNHSWNEAEAKIDHCVKYINELIIGLDFKYPISYQLLELYLYVNKQLLGVKRTRSSQRLDDVAEIIQTLRLGFLEVAKQDNSANVMQNTQKVYAGLTYTKGKLNEYAENPSNRSRGYQA